MLHFGGRATRSFWQRAFTNLQCRTASSSPCQDRAQIKTDAQGSDVSDCESSSDEPPPDLMFRDNAYPEPTRASHLSSPDDNMAFDCGILFNKLKRGLAPSTTAPHPSPHGGTSNKVKDNRVTFLGKSQDWSEFEGVFAKAFYIPGGEVKASQFLTEVSQILLQYYHSQLDRKSKVLDFHHPHQLREIMAHCLDIDESPRDLEQLLSDCKETLKYCVRTGHAHFFNQLSTGLDVIGLAGEWLTAISNTNMFTYEAAPVFTLMEEVVLDRMLQKVGWLNGDGVFAPGGGISNLYGVLLARHKFFPSMKTEGLPKGIEPVVFTSEQSHFSIRRACALLGIGTKNCIRIRCDLRGKMIVSELEKEILAAKLAGKTPFMVNAMAGTTVLGAFDPLNEIADLCETYGLWMHVDGAWGGSILMSRDHRHLFKGLERADSMIWNPHKMMGVPLQCSAILCGHKGLLHEANQMHAEYLFQQDKCYDVSWDTGDKTIQCGRHNDIFKMWLMWRAKGDEGFERQIDHNFEIAKYLKDKLEGREGFHLVLREFEAPTVCFWYLPEAWRHFKFESIPKEKLAKVAPKIKSRMMESGTILVQYQPMGELPNLFRVAISNPILDTHDIDFLVEEIERLGRDIPYPE